jgi:hypothetical protein
METTFIRPRKYAKKKLFNELSYITEAIERGEKEIIIEFSNKEYNMFDISLLISELDNILKEKGKILDFGCKLKEKTIKAKFIVLEESEELITAYE